jgi:hypothetical protein
MQKRSIKKLTNYKTMCKNKYILILLIISVLTGSSCKTRRLFKLPLKEQGPEYLFNKLKENELKYVDLSIRFDADLVFDKKENSFKGNIKIKKDSLIWISITPLFGIEAFRVLFSTDSVKMINKLNNQYFLGDYSMINTMFNTPFDYDMLQSLITGNDFSYYENDIFRAGIDGGHYKLTTMGRRKLKKYVINQADNDKVLIQDIWLDSESFKIVKQDWKEITKQNSKMSFIYNSFSTLEDGQIFPGSLDCNITAENNISLKIKYTKVQVNKPFEFTFIIPENYQPVQ